MQDINALKQVKVGDKLDITWTEALIVGFTPNRRNSDISALGHNIGG